MSKELFDKISVACSKVTTHAYSTSFSLGIRCLQKELRVPIYSIYGFVRFADEIVDAFDGFDKAALLSRFKEETYRAISDKISLNPILNSFQFTVNHYGIEKELVDQFLHSMELDLSNTKYDQSGMDTYILGSAEVVGLMSLRVFSDGNQAEYDRLKVYAMKLGAAFQKVNFLRDLKFDYQELGRTYFPDLDLSNFDESSKRKIEENIATDFATAFEGIKKLPRSARFGVYVAYLYYLALFRKIRNTPCKFIMQKRVRIDNGRKLSILAYSFVKYRLNLL